MVRYIYGVLSLMGLMSCRPGATPSSEIKKNSCLPKGFGKGPPGGRAIVGGVQNTDTRDPRVAATVYLTTPNSTCTGILVNTQLIVTAAHCLSGTGVSIEFDLNRMDTDIGPKRPAHRVHKHPRFTQNTFPDFDIACVTFEDPLPPPFKPIAVYTAVGGLKPRTPVALAGFGLTKTNGYPAGHLRIVDTFFSKYLLPSSTPPGEGLLLIGPNPGKGSCNGDSGGGAFVQGSQANWFAVGVNNGPVAHYFPQVPASAFVNDNCNTGAEIFTSIGYHKEWIEKTSGHKVLTAPIGVPLTAPTSGSQEMGPGHPPADTTGC